MTAQEIKNLLDQKEVTPGVLYLGDDDGEFGDSEELLNYLNESDQNTVESYIVKLVGPFEEVYQQGGEGEGDNYSIVWHFIDHDVYLRVDAYYSSYEGIYWDESNFYEVKPKEKTIVVYE
jgi:hypothetical protein